MTTEAPATTPAGTPAVGMTRAYVQLLITITIWGGYFVVAKKAVDEASPLALSTARYVIGGSILGLLAARRGGFPRPNRREIRLLAAMGATSVFGFNILAFMGLKLAPASDAALVMPTVPSLFVIPLAALLFKERFGPGQLLGLALLVAGELLVFRNALFSEDISGERWGGIGLFVATAFLWALYTLAARSLGGRIGPIHATFYGVVLGLVLLLPIGAWPLIHALFERPSVGLAGAFLYLGVLQTVIALVWWFEGVQAIGASRAAVINTLVPVIALLLAAIFLDDVPGGARIAGAAIVVGGVAMAASGASPLREPFPPK